MTEKNRSTSANLDKSAKRLGVSASRRRTFFIFFLPTMIWFAILGTLIMLWGWPSEEVTQSVSQTITVKDYPMEGDPNTVVNKTTESVSTSTEWRSFEISFLASMLEDTVFFIIVLLIITYFTTRKPEEENIEHRINYLFNDGCSRAKQYAKSEIEKVACYSTKSLVRIRVEEYSEELDAFKVYTDWEFHLANLYHNAAYKNDDSFHVDIDTDDVADEDGVRGAVMKIRTIPTSGIHANTISSQTIDHLTSPDVIHRERYSKKVELSLKPDEQASYEVSFWMWCKNLEAYHLWVRRYTQVYEVKIHNSTRMPLEYTYQPPINERSMSMSSPKPKVERKVLDRQGEVTLYSGEMVPQNDMWVKFTLPEDAEPEGTEPPAPKMG